MLTYQTLSLAEAQLMLDAAQRRAEELGVSEVLCVADAAGYPIALRQLDDGKVSSVQIAMNKAFTASAHRKPAASLQERAAGRGSVRHLHPARRAVHGVRGRHAGGGGGEVVGGIAASGGNGEQDIACCEAGIAALMAHLGG